MTEGLPPTMQSFFILTASSLFVAQLIRKWRLSSANVSDIKSVIERSDNGAEITSSQLASVVKWLQLSSGFGSITVRSATIIEIILPFYSVFGFFVWDNALSHRLRIFYSVVIERSYNGV
jgi:hypothetical protein